MKQRWRGEGAFWRGYVVARVRDQATGETVNVYKRLGRWRYYGDDASVQDRALAATAKRTIEAADREQLGREFRERVAASAGRTTKARRK